MRGQILPRVRICLVWSAVYGPNGCDNHRGYAVVIRWLGVSVDFTVARRVKP
ncbi:hypothetical protein [Sphingomonas paucimobilis]|uniref:hypothetical protein n=1 Tax=Sphingomonas paucimobilis TaxID=13689 RepID=UPI00203D3850|nr:hypothetical protein [Sphingomonas paucimobilis]MCM3679448.1 hypothetical protein [Sphingomonas paucimobilis]